jgi:hypothetical protein
VSPLVVGDSVLVMGRDSVLQRRSLADGSEAESVALTSPSPEAPVQAQLAPVWIGGQVVVTLDLQLPWPRTNLLAFGVAEDAGAAGAAGPDDAGDDPPGVRMTGELRSIPGLVSGRPRLSGSDLFIAGQDQTARVVPGDGPVRTLVTSPAQVTYAIPVGDVVLTTEDEDLVAVPAAGGEPRWRRTVGSPRQGTEPVVAGDTVVVPVFGAGLLAADLATGAPRWLYEQDGTVGTGSPVALPDGDIVYAVGGLVRLDGATGQPRWTVPGFTVYGPIAVGTGVMVLAGVTATGSFLGAFDLVTGQEVWRRPFPAPYLVGPAIGGDTVVAVDANGQAVALDAATGALRWTHAMRTAPGGTPVILGDRVVLAEAGREEDLVSRDTRLTVHDLRTGHYLGSIEPPGFALSRGAFGLTEGSIVTYTVGHGPAIMVLGLE